MKIFATLCLFVLLLVSVDVSSEPLASYKKDAISVTASANGKTIEVAAAAKGLQELQITELQKPTRIVVDLVGPRSTVAKTLDIASHEFLKSIRIGAHPDKVRVVLDLSGDSIPKYTKARKGDGIVITFGAKEKSPAQRATSTSTPQPSATPAETATFQATPEDAVTLTPTPEVTATASTTATLKPTATSTPTATPTAIVTPIATPASTPDAIETTASITPPKEVDVAPPPGQFLLTGVHFDYLPPAFNPVVRLAILGGNPGFKLIRNNDRGYALVVPKTKLKKSNLLLPHYPPQDFTGFTVIQPKQKGNDIEIAIGVSRGFQILAVYQGDGIILRIKNA